MLPDNRTRIATALMQGGPGAAGPQRIPTEGGMMPVTLNGDDDQNKQILPPWASMGLGGMLINGLGSLFNHGGGDHSSSAQPTMGTPTGAPPSPMDFGAAGISPGQIGRIGTGRSPYGRRNAQSDF